MSHNGIASAWKAEPFAGCPGSTPGVGVGLLFVYDNNAHDRNWRGHL